MNNNEKFIPLLKLNYSNEEINYLQNGLKEVLNSGYLTMGEKVLEFEDKFRKFVGVKYAVAVNSGTSAIEIILRSINVVKKSVVVPNITFMATPLAAIHAGAKVIFVDVLPDNLSIDPNDLKNKIRDDTVAVIAVHIGGIISSSWNEINDICEENDLFLLEDAAHAHGASFDGQIAGSLGFAGAFSFYPTKVLTTAEGGMITTDSDQIYEQSLVLREHGKKNPNINIHTELGSNWRFSEIHALLGLLEMKKCESIIKERQYLASIYDEELKGISNINKITIPKNIVSPYYKYIVYLNERYKRETIKNRMKSDFDISLPGEVYSHLCHSQPVFKKYPEFILNNEKDQFPGSQYVADNQICLPLYPNLNKDEIKYVVDSLRYTIGSLN